jgi:hypothetical protein
MATIPSETDSTSIESNCPGVFMASSINVEPTVSLYTVCYRAAGYVSSVKKRYKMKHAVFSMQPVERKRRYPFAQRSVGGIGDFVKHLKHPILAALSALPR